MDKAIGNIRGAIVAIFVMAIVLVSAYGWIENIVKAFHMLSAPVTGMFIARAVGVFVVPLGAVLGYM